MNIFNFLITALGMALSAIGCDALLAMAFDPNGKEEIGMHINNKVKTDSLERQDGDNSLGTQYKLDDLDKGILKIKPYATPVDVITRTGRQVSVNSPEFKFYSQDTKRIHGKTTAAVVMTANDDASDTFAVKVDNIQAFDENDQIMFCGANGYTLDGTLSTSGASQLTMFIQDIDYATKTLTCVPINGQPKTGVPDAKTYTAANITVGMDIINLGRMEDELAMKTAPYSALPRKDFGYCQKFMSATLQSGWSQQVPNEAGWTMADDDELAVENYKQSIERSFIWGKLGKTYPTNENHGKLGIYSCSGVIQQIVEKGGSVIPYTPTTFTEANAIEIMEKIFVGNSGSNNRVLLAGAGFITALSKLANIQRNIESTANERVFGFTWRKWVSNHGTLNLIPLPMFNVVGEYDKKWFYSAIVLDPQHLDKRVFRSMSRTKLDLRSSGIMDADSNVLTETSAPCLKYAKAHALIMPTAGSY